MGLSSRPGRYGDFGPGSGGPATPPGPSGPSIYEQQFREATGGYPSTGPMPSGVGAPPPRVGGPGSAGGGAAIPTSMAPSLGVGSIQPFNNMMQAAQAQVAGGGAQTGQAMVQHVQKAVQVAAPAAQAGGASIGASLNAGTAQGTVSTQSVIDTVMIKHSKHIIDVVAGGLGIHSPSDEFDYLARMTWAGFGRGSDREAPRAFGAMSGHVGAGLSAAQDQQRKFGYDYQDGSPATVSFNPFRMSQPDEDPAKAAADRKASFGNQQQGYKPGSEGWWSAHDNRAGQLAARREQNQRWAIGGGVSHDERRDMLAQNRAGLHERALANLHISGHVKPSGDVNPFAAQQQRSAGLNAAVNPFSALPGLLGKAGENSALGLSKGMDAHVGKIQASGANLAVHGLSGYKKKDKQASPSAAWAEAAGNSVAGAVGGMNAGAPALAAAGAGAASVMQDAALGPMTDRGLLVGQTWATNVLTGADQVLKKSDYTQAGLPAQLKNSPAMLALAGTGLLSAGSGASVWKTVGNSPATVTLPPAPSPPPPQTITFVHKIDISGQIHEIATQISLDHVGRMTDAIAVAPR